MFFDVLFSFARVELLSLWRKKTAIVLFFAVPLVLALTLGPSVSGMAEAKGRSAIGWAVMFSFMTVNYAGRAFYREFWSGTWRQMAMSQPPKMAFLLGKTLPSGMIALVQLTSFTVLAVGVLGLRAEGSFLQLVPIYLLLTMVGVSIGALLFVLTRSIDVFSSSAYLILISFAAVGGSIVASPALPRPARFAGYATPHHWAMRAVDETTMGTGSWRVVFESCGVLGFMVVASAAIVLSRLDFRVEHFGEG